jgi:CheY-like chemotaxis protein
MPATGRAIKALIADPSEKSRRSIGRFLRGKGLETVEVSDGSKALAEALLGHPDVLLLDLSVGVLAPDRLVRILQTNPNTNAIPVFFLSDKGQSVSGFRPGIDEFLRKPVDEEEILLRIQRALFPDSLPGESGFAEIGTPWTQSARSRSSWAGGMTPQSACWLAQARPRQRRIQVGMREVKGGCDNGQH